MATVVEVLSGILRFFPNTMIMTLLVGGIALSRLSWVLISAGALLLSVLVLLIQYLFGKFGIGAMPGTAVLEACSLIPIVRGNATYAAIPSMWVALTTYFCVYIITNAGHIYTQRAAQNQDAIPVQQRKGMGLISMLATLILLVVLVGPRLLTGCEHWGGVVLGGLLGLAAGVAWWYILDACGSNVLPDIHGVMIGLNPSTVVANPMACMLT